MVVAQAGALGVIAYLASRLIESAPPLQRATVMLKESRSFTLPLAGVGIVAWLFNMGDRYLLLGLTDASEVGVYAAAYGLAATPIAALGGLLPTLSYEPLYRAASRGHETRRRLVVSRLLRGQALLVGIGMVATIALAPVAVALLLAPDFRNDATVVMRWVALGQGFQVLAYAMDLDSYSVGRTHRLAIAYGIAVVIAVGAIILLVPTYGAVGAAQATAASGFAYFVSMWLLSRNSAGDTRDDPR
jgi:O-antigen/teichoic acid export membrane protein